MSGNLVSRLSIVFVLAAALCSGADLVTDVRAAAQQGDYAGGSNLIQVYESQRGPTPESILALSWLGRAALAQKNYDQAERYAEETYQRAVAELKRRRLDSEPNLPLALGASIEVRGQSLAARGQRTDALAYLESELRKFAGTSIHARIQKNINLISLTGKPALPLEGVSLPRNKPALLFFWAHWCSDCRAEAPVLAQLKKEFGPRGLAVIGPTQKYGYIGARENVPAAEELAYIESVRRQFYSLVVDAPAPVSEGNFLTYGVSSTPTLALVDAQGIVRMYHPGGMSYADLKAAIEGVLPGP